MSSGVVVDDVAGAWFITVRGDSGLGVTVSRRTSNMSGVPPS